MQLTALHEDLPHAPDRFDWSDLALCKGKTDLFFGPPRERPGSRRRRETLARAYCNVCPVADPCRTSGRENHENGLWGGENEEQRARAGYTPRSTERRSVADAARQARVEEPNEDALEKRSLQPAT